MPGARRRSSVPAIDAPAATPSTLGCSNGQLGLGQALLDERDHGERLAEADEPAQAGDVVGDVHARLGPEATLIVAAAWCARRPPSGSGRGPAGRCAAPSRRGGACPWERASGQEPPGQVVEEARRRSRGRARRCARPWRASAARSHRASGGAAGRSRRRRSPGRRSRNQRQSVNAGRTVGTASAPGSFSASQPPIASISGDSTGERLPITSSVKVDSAGRRRRAPRGARLRATSTPIPGGTRQSTRTRRAPGSR